MLHAAADPWDAKVGGGPTKHRHPGSTAAWHGITATKQLDTLDGEIEKDLKAIERIARAKVSRSRAGQRNKSPPPGIRLAVRPCGRAASSGDSLLHSPPIGVRFRVAAIHVQRVYPFSTAGSP